MEPVRVDNVGQMVGTRSRARPAVEPPDTFPPGRRCPEAGCITVLSIYNPGPWCFCHSASREGEIVEIVEAVDRAYEERMAA